mgnify:CR=1 FL=1
MKTTDIIQESISSLLANKARSGLTILGIIIGIASVVAMISLGEGTQHMIESNIESLGSNLITIMPGALRTGIISGGLGSAQSLKNDDIKVIEKIPGVALVSPEIQRRYQIVYSAGGTNTNSLVIGGGPNYFSAHNMQLERGSLITEDHVRNYSKVVVLGNDIANDLFGDTDPIGKAIKINRVNFKVIGVLQAKGGMGMLNIDDMAIVPVTTMQQVLAGIDYLTTITVKIENRNQMSQAQALITEALAKKHKVSILDPDFTILSQEDILSTLNQVMNTFTIFLSSIAGISLLVGGIGIMNMMLTSVTERIKEIGLRKAIGAKRSDIAIQFLTESVALTVLGGIIGIICGWVGSIIMAKVINVSAHISLGAIILAFGVSSLIGIIFGYYPAKKAASLNPIDALRYE